MNCKECDEPGYSTIEENYSTDEEITFEELEPAPERNTKTVEFSSLSAAEKQAWVDFCFHEIERHEKDIARTSKELQYIKERYGIEPRSIYVATWVLIK